MKRKEIIELHNKNVLDAVELFNSTDDIKKEDFYIDGVLDTITYKRTMVNFYNHFVSTYKKVSINPIAERTQLKLKLEQIEKAPEMLEKLDSAKTELLAIASNKDENYEKSVELYKKSLSFEKDLNAMEEYEESVTETKRVPQTQMRTYIMNGRVHTMPTIVYHTKLVTKKVKKTRPNLQKRQEAQKNIDLLNKEIQTIGIDSYSKNVKAYKATCEIKTIDSKIKELEKLATRKDAFLNRVNQINEELNKYKVILLRERKLIEETLINTKHLDLKEIEDFEQKKEKIEIMRYNIEENQNSDDGFEAGDDEPEMK